MTVIINSSSSVPATIENSSYEERQREASTREKEIASTIKLFKFVFILAGIFLLLIQLASLAHLFFNENTGVSYSVSKEEVSIPSLSICIRTLNHLNSSALKKYGIDSSYFDFDGMYKIKEKWRDFPWSESSLDQLYADALIYPYQYLTKCQAGGEPCMEQKGAFYFWKRQKTRVATCSTIVMNKKLKSGTFSIYVELNKESQILHDTEYPQFILHDGANELLPYSTRQMLMVKKMAGRDTNIAEQTFTIEKHTKVRKSSKNACVEDINYSRYQCMLDCIEHSILDDGGCKLPWTKAQGKACTSSNDLEHIVRREIRVASYSNCFCPEPCISWHLTSQSIIGYEKPIDGEAYGAVISNAEGIYVMEEMLLLAPLELLAAIGGTLGIFVDVSLCLLLVFLLQIIISTACNLGAMMFNSFFGKEKTLVTFCSCAFQVICVLLFCYQGYELIYQYIQFPKMISLQTKARIRTPPPVVFCSYRMNNSFDWSYVDTYGEEYITNYRYASPRRSMRSCSLMKEDCRTENGKYFHWTRFLGLALVCDAIQTTSSFQDSDSTGVKTLSVTYRWEDVSYIEIGNSHLQASKYKMIFVSSYADVIQTEARISYTVQETWRLPPCLLPLSSFTEDYMDLFMNMSKDACIMPFLPPHPGLRLCSSLPEEQRFFETFLEFFTLVSSEIKSESGLPCSEVSYDFGTVHRKSYLDRGYSAIHIEMLPVTESSREEVWKNSLSQLIGGLGGLLGLLTGYTILFILHWIMNHVHAFFCQKRRQEVVNGASFVVKLLLWIAFLFEAYNSSKNFMKGDVITQVTIKNKEDMTMPVITVCVTDHRIWEADLQDKLITHNYEDRDDYGRNVITPIKAADLNEHVPVTPFHAYKQLGICSVFGHSCLEETGHIHKWRYTSSSNQHCSILETNLTYLSDEMKSNYIAMQKNYNSYGIVVYITDGNNMPSLYNDIRLKEFFIQDLDFNVFEIGFTTLKKIQKDEFEDCEQDVNYNFKKCLENCIDAHVMDTLNCTFPFKQQVPGFEFCYRHHDYNYLDIMNYTFTQQCPCKKSCYIKELNKKIPDFKNQENLMLVLADTEEEYEEILSYTFIKLLADLGGALVTFTGLTIFQVIKKMF